MPRIPARGKPRGIWRAFLAAGLYTLEADTVGDAIARGAGEAAAMSHADSLGNMAVLDQWRAAVGMRYDGV